MSNQIAEKIAKTLGVEGLRPFEPVAYYDKHMDCIRVELRDCSFTEERKNQHITFLEDNYPAANRSATAGIMIKGVKHLFSDLKLPLDGIVYVTTILDRLVKQYPELADSIFCKMVNEIDLTVDMSEAGSLNECEQEDCVGV
jgi:hypothetical protein